MDAKPLRPQFHTFRVTSFTSESRIPESAFDNEGGVKLEFKTDIEMGILKTEIASGMQFEAIVTLQFTATASDESIGADAALVAHAVYKARFKMPPELKEKQLVKWFEMEDNQYSLCSQAFPLAMMHFRREITAMGLNIGALPLGLPV